MESVELLPCGSPGGRPDTIPDSGEHVENRHRCTAAVPIPSSGYGPHTNRSHQAVRSQPRDGQSISCLKVTPESALSECSSRPLARVTPRSGRFVDPARQGGWPSIEVLQVPRQSNPRDSQPAPAFRPRVGCTVAANRSWTNDTLKNAEFQLSFRSQNEPHRKIQRCQKFGILNRHTLNGFPRCLHGANLDQTRNNPKPYFFSFASAPSLNLSLRRLSISDQRT